MNPDLLDPRRGKSAIDKGLVRPSVNTTPLPVLKISTPGFFIKFRIHGKETLRKEIGTFRKLEARQLIKLIT
jgi:hypothetical protein